MKLLLYCTKEKPRLVYRQWTSTLNQIGIDNSFEGFLCGSEKSVGINELGECEQLNGKIVAECDFEVEWCDTSWCCSNFIEHKGLEKSCLTKEQLFDYVKGRNEFYAIHIKNLHIFDKPKELNDYYKFDGIYNDINNWKTIDKAPQNMMYAYDLISELGFSGTYNMHLKKNILISIQSQWMCLILNRIKDVEVRKVVLKEMLENE